MSAYGRGKLTRLLVILGVGGLMSYALLFSLDYATERNNDLTAETWQALIRDVVEINETYRQRQLADHQPAIYPGRGQATVAVESPGLVQAKELGQFRDLFFPEDYSWPFTPSGGETGIWQQNESYRHNRALVDRQFDLIVLPVQENSPHFDRVARLMSARWLAHELRTCAGFKVMSPELALRALGGRVARFDDVQVAKLAKQSGAKVIYLLLSDTASWRYDGLRMAVIEVDTKGAIAKRALRTIEYPPDSGSFDVQFKAHVRSIVEEMYGTAPSRERENEAATAGRFELPQQIDGLVDQTAGPLQQAARLQLIALLTPEYFEYERRRLFERSLLAVEGLDASQPYVGLINARAYFYLSRRPVAMQFLESVKTPAERALREFLNGNYPQLVSEIDKIEEPVFRLMSSLEMKSLAYSYQKDVEREMAASGEAEGWSFLVNAAARDRDIWYAPDNMAFFSQLKGLFPRFDESYARILGERLVSGSVEGQSDFDKLFEDLFTASLTSDESGNCCMSYDGNPEISDIWLLYRNLATANLLRRLDRSVNVHASFKTAVQYGEKLLPLLKGQPTFTRLYAQAVSGLAGKTQGGEREYLQKKAFRLAQEVGEQSQSIDRDTLKAGMLMERMVMDIGGDEYAKAMQVFNVFSQFDVPTVYQKQTLYKSVPESLAYTNTSFGVFKAMAKKQQWDIHRTTEELSGRFNGHPEKSVYLAQRSISEGKEEQALKVLEEAVAKGEDSWKIYRSLGSVLINDGRYEAAKDAYLKYPYFSDIGNMNRVEISNYAYEAGSRLFWLGRYEEAQPFYEIAGEMRTGSGGQFSSIQRLAMLEQDFRQAIEYAYRRGQRYNDKFGYRDYLVFLHLIGAHKEADAGFKALVNRFKRPVVWTAPFVGHRMRDFKFEDSVKWAHQVIQGSDNVYLKANAQNYLIRQALIDRAVDPQQLPAVASLSNPEVFAPRHKRRHSELRAVFTSEVMANALNPCAKEQKDCADTDPLSEYNGRDFLLTFMDAYQDLFAGSYQSSLGKFLAMDAYYSAMDNGSLSMTLPYLLMAASQVVPNEVLQQMLERLQQDQAREGSDFERALSESVLLSALEQNDAALKALNRAFHNRPHTHSRAIYTWYEITTIAEWLSQQSGDGRFLGRALEWARRYQKIQPQFAWAYAFEALYAKDEEDRIRAAAFAQYLDPQSAWLSKVPEAIRKKAAERWPRVNPFILKEDEATQPTAET